MTQANDIGVFDRVADGQISPEAGAQAILNSRQPRRQWPPRQPQWMSRRAYMFTIIVLTILLAPVLILASALTSNSRD